ncbi:hypothetical protein VTK56DRAFT_4676 [Thermocarpiscus australiensis]
MSFAISAVMAAMFLLLGGARGHMVMNYPTPYNLNTPPLLQVDPISGGRFPFPCHNHYGFTSRTLVEAGGATLVNFTGGGQHGGGSCQFSISYDEPTDGGDWNKSAKFKTIYSIIGGCPAVFTDETRNLPPAAMDPNMRRDSKHCGDDQGIDCIRQFMIPLPNFLKNGPATFAWTWFNKLGNREMYMNCAPVTITSGTGDQKQIDSLPDIFIANYFDDPELPSCVTGTSADKIVLNFPNPGKYGRVLQPPLEPALKPADYCAQIPPASVIPNFEADPRTIMSGGGSSSTTSSSSGINSVSTTSSSTQSPAPASSTSAVRTTSKAASTSSATVASSTTPSTTATVTTEPYTEPDYCDGPTSQTVSQSSNYTSGFRSTKPTPPFPLNNQTSMSMSMNMTVSKATIIPTGAGAGPGTIYPLPTSDVPQTSGNSVPCPKHGELVCLGDGTMFGLCNRGWATPQPVAAGTVCKDGAIVLQDGSEVGKADSGGASTVYVRMWRRLRGRENREDF